MNERILFVDDEPAVLDGYRRMLYGEFEVETAVGGAAALAAIERNGPYAVVVSDMRMPGMTGAEFLSSVRLKCPDTIRLLLTGYSDATAAIAAVNEGYIFRYLTKPCNYEELCTSLRLAVDKCHSAVMEKELLEKTLMGSVSVLTEVLSAVSPEAFGRSMRIASTIRHLLRRHTLSSPWQVEIAAMLSQLGCVTLDPQLLRLAYFGKKLSVEDEARFAGHPYIGYRLLVKIPRMESTAWIVRRQLGRNDDIQDKPKLSPADMEELDMAESMLRIAVAYDGLRLRGFSDEESITWLWARKDDYPRKLVETLEDMSSNKEVMELRKVPANKLAVGMILSQELRDRAGSLLVAKDQQISDALLVKILNYDHVGLIDREVVALVPRERVKTG